MDSHEQENCVRRTQRIRELNDRLRTTGRGGRTVVTRAVAEIPADMLERLLDAVRRFDAFDERCDPYGERDMALVTLDGEVFAWKIDYFDSDMTHGSPDAADETVTRRVLTLMTAADL